jgi:hypothetical protein
VHIVLLCLIFAQCTLGDSSLNRRVDNPPLRNFTIALPATTSSHGDPHILCPLTTWTSIAIFFIGNYLAHAATVKLPPATSSMTNLRICFSALLMPASGLIFALRAFAHAVRGIGKSEAQKVGIAGGLYMYARSTGWRPPGIVTSLHTSVGPREFSRRLTTDRFLLRLLERYFRHLQHLSKTLPSEYLRKWANALATSLVLHELGTSEEHQSVFRLMILSASAQVADTASAEVEQLPDGNEFLIALAYANDQICSLLVSLTDRVMTAT